MRGNWQLALAATAKSQRHDRARARALTLCEAFQRTAGRFADQPALRTPGDRESMTWREYATRVEQVAGGLAQLGVGEGDTVALMLHNRPEFHVLDTAALHLGATPFSIYNTASPAQIADEDALSLGTGARQNRGDERCATVRAGGIPALGRSTPEGGEETLGPNRFRLRHTAHVLATGQNSGSVR